MGGLGSLASRALPGAPLIRRRRRFRDVVERQLDLFAVDEARLFEEASTADDAWTHAPREESEERFGEYQLVVDAIAERLYDVRESYAATLDDGTAEEYRAEFDRTARKRHRGYTGLLDE